MRNQLIDQIHEEMHKDEKIFFLTADMGINLVEKIENKYPKRFLNVGIAEQNLISVASGLINTGFKVAAYTISNFIIHRCFEQIRNDISLHNKPIVLIGTSCGYDNASLGPTHHVIDDWVHIKSLPNFSIFCPSNIKYTRGLFKKLINKKNPIYLRIPKGNFDGINSLKDIDYLPSNNNKNIFLTYGSLVSELFPLYKEYKQSVLIFNKLHPINKNLIYNILKKYKKIYIVEEQFASNGLYGSICNMFINLNLKIEIISLAPVNYNFKNGKSNKFFFKLNNIDLKSLVKKINK